MPINMRLFLACSVDVGNRTEERDGKKEDVKEVEGVKGGGGPTGPAGGRIHNRD